MIIVSRQNSISAKPATGIEGLLNPAYHYRIAGRSVLFPTQVNALRRFACDYPADLKKENNNRELPGFTQVDSILDQSSAQLLYQGRAPFNNIQQLVRCWQNRHLIQIDIGGQAICQIDPQRDHIHLLNSGSFSERLNLEVLTGPALIILLASKGVFCLHAGAIATKYGNIAVVAESGVGKSTLTAHVDTHWQQIADDILPVIHCGDNYRFDGYPQLKLPDNVVKQRLPKRSTIDLIVRLHQQAESTIKIKPLARTESMLQIIRHTVAAKLFNQALLRSHTQFANKLSSRVPMVQLCYPRDLSRLGDVRELLIDYLKTASKLHQQTVA